MLRSAIAAFAMTAAALLLAAVPAIVGDRRGGLRV